MSVRLPGSGRRQDLTGCKRGFWASAPKLLPTASGSRSAHGLVPPTAVRRARGLHVDQRRLRPGPPDAGPPTGDMGQRRLRRGVGAERTGGGAGCGNHGSELVRAGPVPELSGYRTGCPQWVFAMPLGDIDVDYVRPQESGARSGVRSAALVVSGYKLEISGEPFALTVWPYSMGVLERPRTGRNSCPMGAHTCIWTMSCVG